MGRGPRTGPPRPWPVTRAGESGRVVTLTVDAPNGSFRTVKSITMHKLDPLVAKELEKRARAQGRSLNSTAQDLLRSALGISGAQGIDRTDAFKDLCGTWGDEDLREFRERTADLDRVDSSEWQG